MKRTLVSIACTVIMVMISCACARSLTMNNGSVTCYMYSTSALPIDDQGRVMYTTPDHSVIDLLGANKFLIDGNFNGVCVGGYLLAPYRLDSEEGLVPPEVTCHACVVSGDGRTLYPASNYSDNMLGLFTGTYDPPSDPRAFFWFVSGQGQNQGSWFVDPEWGNLKYGMTYYVTVDPFCVAGSTAVDQSPYPEVTGSYTCYVLPQDGDLPQPDPCGSGCSMCAKSQSVDPPKPGIKTFSRASKDSPNNARQVDWFLPDSTDLLKEVRVDGGVRVIFRTQFQAPVYWAQGGLPIGHARTPTLPVYVYKLDVALPSGSTHYPDTQAWSLTHYGTVVRTQSREDGGVKYTIRRSGGMTSIVRFSELPGPPTFEQVARPKIIGITDAPSFTQPQGWTYDSQDRLVSYTEGGQSWTITYLAENQQGEQQQKIEYPDGSYAIITYYAETNTEGAYEGQARVVEFFSYNDLSMSSISYQYDDKGRISHAQKGDRQVSYVYDDDDQTIIYTEMSASPHVQTVYHYGRASETGELQPGEDETWVIRKHTPNDVTSFETGDRRIKYEFTPDRSQLVKYTDPMENVTQYDLEDYPDSYQGYGEPTKQRVHMVTDPAGLVTEYTYDDDDGVAQELGITNPKGNLVSVSQYKNEEPYTHLYEANLDYCKVTNSTDTTQWLKSISDASGTVVLDRNDFDNFPWRVDAVKVQSGVDENSEPIYDTVREFEYYGGTTEDIAISLIPTWDHAYSDPDARPANLCDGDVGPEYEDVGIWNYGSEFDEGVAGCFYCANASRFEWSGDRTVSRIDLYVDPGYVDPNRPGLTEPEAVRIYAKDAQGNYTNIVYETNLQVAFEPWNTEEWNSKQPGALHVDLSSQPVTTSGLRIVYGSESPCHLGEVEVMAQSIGNPSVLEQLNVTVTGEHAYSDPDTRPDYLNDGSVGSGYEDAGNWDYGMQGSQTLYANNYTHANASVWEWTGNESIDQVNLYIDPDLEDAVAPEAVRIYSKDDEGEYSTLVYATPYGSTETWTSGGTLGGHDASVLQIKLGVATDGLKIIYGADELCHLGEVQIIAASGTSTEGKSGQLKRVTVPDVDGSQDAWVEFKYSQDNKILDKPTEFDYPYYSSPTATTYEVKTCSVQYDDTGRVTGTTDANNRGISLAYEIIEEQEGVGSKLDTLTYTEDAKLRVHGSCCGADWFSDEEGRKIHLTYDQAGRPVNAYVDGTGQSDTSPLIGLGDGPESAFDAFNKVTTVSTFSEENGDARASTYEYDDDGRPVSMSYPDDLIGDEQVQYDSVGNLLWAKDGKDLYTLFHYNDLHMMDAIAYSTQAPSGSYNGTSPTPAITVGYDSATGQVDTVTKGSDTVSFEYDYKGRVTSYTPAGRSEIGYTYNNLDQVASITTGSYNVSYEYYANGLLKRVNTVIGSNTIPLAEYTYDQAGLLQYIDYGNGVRCAPAYASGDPRYPLSSITYTKSGNTLGSFGYTTRDYSLNPTAITDTMHIGGLTTGGTVTFDEYGPLGELTNATYDNPTPDQPVGGPYVNDWVGNRTSPPSGTNAMLYNAVDQLVAWPGMHGVDAGTPGYVYDANGNLIYVKNVAGDANVAAYGYYDDSNLLYTATYNSHTLTNTWDVFGNRSSVAVNGHTYSFTYNIAAGVPAVIEEVDSGGKTYYYYRDPGGALIARRDASDPDSLQYYHYDELGSTRIITDNSGAVTDTYSYDAYGGVIAHVGSTTDNPYQYVGALGYYTHYQDPSFKLLQLGYMFYDPETGRFTQQDPAGDGINWYAYCGGNPMGGVDPWGLYSWGDFVRWFGGTKGDSTDQFLDNYSQGAFTGLNAVGSAATFGYYDGGRWRNQPGFGTSYKLGTLGALAAYTAAGYGISSGAVWLINLPKVQGLWQGWMLGAAGGIHVLGKWPNNQTTASELGAGWLNVDPTNYSRAANLLYILGLRYSNAYILFSDSPNPALGGGFALELQWMKWLGMSAANESTKCP